MKNAIDKLYQCKKWQYSTKRMLRLKVKEYYDVFDINLTDNNGTPDCVIEHFGYNRYIRTPYGLREKRYKNIKTMFYAIKKVLKNNGLTIENLIIEKHSRHKTILK